jgi:hypothetical protein
MKVVINRCYGGFSVSPKIYNELNIEYDGYGFLDNKDFNISSPNSYEYRADKNLIAAIEKIGLKEVPVLQIGHLSETQKRAYIIADNRLALDAGWDEEMLKIEFDYLANDGFNLDLTGFDIGEISSIFDESKGVKIGNEIDEIENHSFVIKYPLDKKIEVMNLLATAIKNVVGVTLWCDDEQV